MCSNSRTMTSQGHRRLINPVKIATTQREKINLHLCRMNFSGWPKRQHRHRKSKKKSDIMLPTFNPTFPPFLIICIDKAAKLSYELGKIIKLKLTLFQNFSLLSGPWPIWEFGKVVMNPLTKMYTKGSNKFLEIIVLRKN